MRHKKDIRVLIRGMVRECLNEGYGLKTQSIIKKILEKIKEKGLDGLSPDEQTYLKQVTNRGEVDFELEDYLDSDHIGTFNQYGEKLPYDEFGDGEDFYINEAKKLKRVITKRIGKNPIELSENRLMWPLQSQDNKTGVFLLLDSIGHAHIIRISKNEDDEEEYEYKLLEHLGFIDTKDKLERVFAKIGK